MSRVQSNPSLTNGVAPVGQERFLRFKKQLHEQLITGMDLSAIGTKASRENLFESLLYPSKAIADQFVNWQVTTKKGVTLGGLIVD